MEKTIRLIEEFAQTIKFLREEKDNVIIGGAAALKMHGLEIGREVDDLDVIIYSPTENQKRILDTLELISKTKYYGPEENRRTIKIENNKLVLNIIKEAGGVPRNLLSVNFRNSSILIQSISNVIKAKVGYTMNYDDGTYMRAKDMKDLVILKNLNFNFE